MKCWIMRRFPFTPFVFWLFDFYESIYEGSLTDICCWSRYLDDEARESEYAEDFWESN